MKSPFAACVGTLAALGVMIALYAMLYTAVGAKSVAVADLARRIDAKTAESSRLASIREQLSALSGEAAAIQSYFVPDAGVVSFIDELQSRGTALGASVEITSVSAAVPDTTKAKASGTGSRPRLLVSLTITGPFDAVMRTVGSIEYAPYDIALTNLAITQGQDKAWAGSANLSVGSVPSNP